MHDPEPHMQSLADRVNEKLPPAVQEDLRRAMSAALLQQAAMRVARASVARPVTVEVLLPEAR